MISRFVRTRRKKLLINPKYVTMKKIYLSLAAIALCGAVFGQASKTLQENTERFRSLDPYKRQAQPVQMPGERGVDYSYWVDPVVDMMWNKGVKLAETPYENNEEIRFLAPLFQDSTVFFSSDANKTRVSYQQIGNILDLKSIYLKPEDDQSPSGGTVPINTPVDPYTIDSIRIFGSYVRVDKTVDDTLYIWLTWGDSTDANIFTKRTLSSLWNGPLGKWKKYGYGQTVQGASASDGNVISPKAGASNMMLIKRPLTAADTSKGYGYSKDIYVKVGANIPAGKTVACFYTYVPNAATVTKDKVFYGFGTGVSKEINGFAAAVFEQNLPKIDSLGSYKDYQIDPDHSVISTGTRMTKNARYNKNALSNSLISIPVSTPDLNYKISGKSSVGITEHTSNFSLAQNMPNPFKNETTIVYNLKTQAKNVSLVIYDVAGVKLFEKTQTNVGSGRYTVEVNNTNFAAGIYFYSLTVDGNRITKKMIVAE